MRCVIISAGEMDFIENTNHKALIKPSQGDKLKQGLDLSAISEYKHLDGSSFEFLAEDFIICADGGYSHAKKLGITPNIIVGDMDSFFGELPKEIEFLGFDSVKDDTDTMLAIKEGLRRGGNEFVLIGALGGRLDHTYANIQSLAYIIENGGTGCVLDNTNSITIIKNTKSIIKPRYKYSLSVFSYSDVSTGVYLRGLQYPLVNATVKKDFPIGVSNKFTEENAEIEVANGTLLVMLCRL